MDVRDPSRVNEVVHEWRPEVVVHLASIVTPGKDSTRALERAVDVDGTGYVLDACLAHGVRRIVVSSSGAAYGYHPDNPEWITEDQPVRGNEEFAYADHKRIVEEMLAELRERRPELEQVVLRIGTILGERVDNQITALFQRPRLLKIRGSQSPFVFIWDTDVAAIIQQAVTGEVTGVFNVAGDGALTVDEIAARARQAHDDAARAGAPAGARGRPAARRHGVRTGADEVPPVPPRARQHPAQGGLRLRAVVHQRRGVRGMAAGASLVRPGILFTCAQSGKVPSPSAWSASR